MVQRKAQGAAKSAGGSPAVSQPHDPAEKEADAVSEHVAAQLHGAPSDGTAPSIGAAGATVGRQIMLSPDDDGEKPAGADEAQAAGGEATAEEQQEQEIPPEKAPMVEEMVTKPREQALKELLDQAKAGGIEIRADEEAQQYLDWCAKRAEAPPEAFHAVTLGDLIFVRPEHAASVRVLREELIHVEQQQRPPDEQPGPLEAEIEARLMMIHNRYQWGITQEEVQEMLEEVRKMKETGKY
jgi:hypothetical protein